VKAIVLVCLTILTCNKITASESVKISLKQDNTITITKPIYAPRGAFDTKEEMLAYANKASLPALVGYYRTVWGLNFGIEPSIKTILDTIKSIRKPGVKSKTMDRAAKRIEKDYYNNMKLAKEELEKIWLYFPLNKEQVYKLVAVNLEPHFEKVDIHLKGSGLARTTSIKKYTHAPVTPVKISTKPIFTPRGAFESKQEMVNYAHKAARRVMVEYFAKKGLRFGIDPSIEVILDTLKSFRDKSIKDMDKVAEDIKRDYYRNMGKAEQELSRIWRYFSPDKEQIDKFIEESLKQYLKRVDKHLRRVKL